MSKPKNGVTGRSILCDFGYPWWIVATWSEANGQWVGATLQAGICEGKEDPYYENEWFDDEELIRWIEMPSKVSAL